MERNPIRPEDLPPARPLVPTAVPGLDVLLHGGLPVGTSLLIAGAPGTGKTVLASQIAFRRVARGDRVIVVTLTSESHDKFLLDLRPFEFFDPEPVGNDLLVISAYAAATQGPREARDLLLTSARRHGARLVVVDGLRSLCGLLSGGAAFRDLLYEVGVGLSALGCSLIATTEHSLDQVLDLPEATTIDGLIVLSRDSSSRRQLEVVKVRGIGHVVGRHTMRLDVRGIRVFPRLESLPRSDQGFVPSGARASFGVPALDDLLHGGLPERTTTLVAGSTGIGKTLLGLQFVAEGARRGEKALFFSFNEPAGSLVARARGIGLDLPPLLESRRLHLEYPPPIEHDADEVGAAILDRVEAEGIRRLVIDGVEPLQEAVSVPTRVPAFLTALVARLRSAGTTTLLLKGVGKAVGPELDFGETPLAGLAENLILVRRLQVNGSVRRAVSVLNLRDSAFDPEAREFEISAGGFRLFEAAEHGDGPAAALDLPLGGDGP